MCVFEYVCASVCVCVPCECVSSFVRECVRVVSRANLFLYFFAYAHARANVGGGRKGKRNLSSMRDMNSTGT